ncbi:MAG: hypothetical protein J6A59_03380 [Lachnospiraceae bacterium]|nr:hypothetical protein [Lachnospiraceae bacterium]
MATKKIGLNLGEVILVVFIILKLTKVIDWSWWWVLSPTWIGLIVVILILGYIAIRAWIES